MKRLLLLALCLSIVGALWATPATPEDDGPITIKFWTHEDPARTEIEERYIEEFEAANPGVTVETGNKLLVEGAGTSAHGICST